MGKSSAYRLSENNMSVWQLFISGRYCKLFLGRHIRRDFKTTSNHRRRSPAQKQLMPFVRENLADIKGHRVQIKPKKQASLN